MLCRACRARLPKAICRPSLRRFVHDVSGESDGEQGLVKKLLRRKLPIEVAYLHPTNGQRLDATFADSGLRPSGDKLGTNYLAYFAPATRESDLLEDGTDVLHAPDRSYKYRLWARGHFNVNLQEAAQPAMTLSAGAKCALIERIEAVRVKDGKIHVQILRDVAHSTGGSGGEFDRTLAAIQSASTEHERLERSYKFAKKYFGRNNEGKPTPRLSTGATRLLQDMRWLTFSREKISLPQAPVLSSPLWEDVFLQHSLATTPAMLFRFSALTFNAHAIHLDPEYTKKEYGFPNLLVHGPMILHMLHCHARSVADRFRAQNGTELAFADIQYDIVSSIFVNETIEIRCTTPKPDPKPDAPANRFLARMWIMKRASGGKGYVVCAKAKVRFKVPAQEREDASIAINTAVPEDANMTWGAQGLFSDPRDTRGRHKF